MLSLRSLLLVISLLAALALAAPTRAPYKRRSIQKRSFIVPRSLNKNHPRGLNGFDAMRKIALKYNMPILKDVNLKEGFIDMNRNGFDAVSTLKTDMSKGKGKGQKGEQDVTPDATNGTGIVEAAPEQNAALFLSPVTIGGQTLNLDFDSGSSDLWVFSTDLPAAATRGHAAFDASKSSTFKPIANAQFSISYGDGSGAAGTVGTDVVEIGGVVVENQAIELANAVSRSFVQDQNTDGLVGLAFSKLNTVNDGTQRTPQKTFFDNIMADLDLPVFTADLDPDGSGVYEFGRIDTTKFTGDLTTVAVNSSSGFWQFASSSFAVGNQTFKNPAASAAIADTGTSLLLVDQIVADTYYAAVPGAVDNAQVGGFVYPCDTVLPDLKVAIGDKGDMALIPGSVITFAEVDDQGTVCFGGVQGNGGAGLQIFGDTLFKSQFVVFDGEKEELGFGEKPLPAAAGARA